MLTANLEAEGDMSAPELEAESESSDVPPTKPSEAAVASEAGQATLPYGRVEKLRPIKSSNIRTTPTPYRCQSFTVPQRYGAAPIRRSSSNPRSLPPPQALLVPENLLHIVKLYFENSCRRMLFDDDGNLRAPDGAKLDYAPYNDFDSYCFTATMLVKKGLYVEFRYALSKALALIKQMLQAEHPRALACFLEVFIHLTQCGLPEVVSMLRNYVKSMSAEVIRKGHPWGQICHLLGELDSKHADQAMAQIWKCTTNIFYGELGTSNRLAVSVRLDYIKRVVRNPFQEERLLRDLLDQSKGIPGLSTPRVMLNLAHTLNKQQSYKKAEEMALNVFSLLGEHDIYALRIVEKIECLKIAAFSQFGQGNFQAAEQTMRGAIMTIVDQWGWQHSWVPEFMCILEGWLRDRGQQKDAEVLREEIEKMVRFGATDA